MASQNENESSEASMSPGVDQEPNCSPSSKEDSREGLVRQDGQDIVQIPLFEESPAAEDQRQPSGNEENYTDLFNLPFPRKLWAIVQSEEFKSVNWTEKGDTIKIEVDLFQKEVLQRKGAKKIFETDSLKSFIRQLHLYGFRKIRHDTSVVSSEENRRIMMYCNFNFQRDNPALLDYIWGKKDLGSLAHQGICVPIPLKSYRPASKRKKLPTRFSPRFYRKPEGEDGEEAKKVASNDQEPTENQRFVFSSVWALKSVPRCLLENPSPGETPGSNPAGEGTSRNTTCVPPAAPRIQGTEEMPSSSSSGYPILGSMMSLYNSCSSVVLSSLSERQTNEPPDEEEQEGASEDKYVLYESMKDSPPHEFEDS